MSLGGNPTTSAPTPTELRLLVYLNLVPGRHSIRWLVAEVTIGNNAAIDVRKRLIDNEWLDKYGNVTEVGLRHIPPILTQRWMTRKGQYNTSTTQTLLNHAWSDERAWGIRGLIVLRMAQIADERYLTAQNLVDWLGVDLNAARSLLRRWVAKDLVVKTDRGQWAIICNPLDEGGRWDGVRHETVMKVEARVDRMLVEQAVNEAKLLEGRAEWELHQFGPDSLREEALRAFKDYDWTCNKARGNSE